MPYCDLGGGSSAATDQELLSTTQLQDSSIREAVEGASLHGEHAPSRLVSVAVQSHPWLSLEIVCTCLVLLSYLIM